MFLNLVLKLPFFFKSKIIRQIIRFPSEIDPKIRFKVAETKEELEQAFAILHDSYVMDQLMKPHPSGLRVTKYHALPSTTTLIALEDNIVVGTISLVRKNSFGLPLESIFSLDHLTQGNRIVEVSSLAIKKSKRHQRGRILFPLLKFMYHYSSKYFGATHFAIAVNPKWWDFYESILLFKRLTKKPVASYDFVNGAPAVGGILNLNHVFKDYLKVYGGKSFEKNLFHFFLDSPWPTMEFPMRKRGMIWDPVLTPEMLKYFFVEKTETLKNLSDFEVSILRELYHTEEYRQLISIPKTVALRMRKEKRFETLMTGRVLSTDGQSIPITIHNVAHHSLDGYVNGSIPNGLLRLHIDLEDYKGCQFDGVLLKKTSSGFFVAKIPNPPESWKNFIAQLDNRLLQKNENDDLENSSNSSTNNLRSS